MAAALSSENAFPILSENSTPALHGNAGGSSCT